MIKIPKDPLYEVSGHDWAWLIALWLIALAAAIAVGAVMVAEAGLPRTEAKAPASSCTGYPDGHSHRTDIRTGRITCEKTGEHGCTEWGIYRTTGN